MTQPPPIPLDSPGSTPPTPEEKTADLKRREERLRSRLAGTLEALDMRRHEFFNVRHQLGHLRKPLAYVGAGVAVLVGIHIARSAYQAHQWKAHKNRERWQAVLRMWEHPERILR